MLLPGGDNDYIFIVPTTIVYWYFCSLVSTKLNIMMLSPELYETTTTNDCGIVST